MSLTIYYTISEHDIPMNFDIAYATLINKSFAGLKVSSSFEQSTPERLQSNN